MFEMNRQEYRVVIGEVCRFDDGKMKCVKRGDEAATFDIDDIDALEFIVGQAFSVVGAISVFAENDTCIMKFEGYGDEDE